MYQHQPRGLPGFLRRTLRSTYEDDMALPMPSTDSSDGVVEDADDIEANEEATNDAKSQGHDTASNALDVTDTKPLRTVAFPPLPREQRDEDHPSNPLTDTLSKDSSIGSASTSTNSNNNDNNNNNSQQQQQPKSYKEIQFDSLLQNNPIIPLRSLRTLSWNGIPPHHRSLCWKILLGYLPSNSSRHINTLCRKRAEYAEARKQHYDISDDSRTAAEQETLRQVLVDVPRTAPEVPLFHNDRIRRLLSRVLYIWGVRHPASSYVQGINDLATPFVVVFLSGYFYNDDGVGGNNNGDNHHGRRGVIGDGEKDALTECLNNPSEILSKVSEDILEQVEADTYWCLTNLLAGIQDHYTSDQPGMQRMVMRLEELTNRIDEGLCLHLKETGIEFMQFAFKWMNCLLLREFRLSCVIRLWDTYLSEGNGGFEDFHVYVCASFLVHFSSELQEMGFDELFQFMQNMPTEDWGDREIEILLSSAFVLSTLFGGSEAHLNVVRATI